MRASPIFCQHVYKLLSAVSWLLFFLLFFYFESFSSCKMQRCLTMSSFSLNDSITPLPVTARKPGTIRGIKTGHMFSYTNSLLLKFFLSLMHFFPLLLVFGRRCIWKQKMVAGWHSKHFKICYNKLSVLIKIVYFWLHAL